MSIYSGRYSVITYNHVPVMPEETVSGLNLRPDGVYIDGTLGGAGHAGMIARQLTTGKLIGIDRDGDAVANAIQLLSVYGEHCIILRGNFMDMRKLVSDINVVLVDGILLDLGVSSYQLDTPERGFSYVKDGRLDMRMDDRDSLNAYEVVNEYTEKQLAEIFFTYGEERNARRIARAILRERQIKPVETTARLAEIVMSAIPPKNRGAGGHHARVFQAIRIEVNDELRKLGEAVTGAVNLLSPGGRICVITFHSLEDRIVKHSFKSMANPCTCPRDLPVCVCGRKPLVKLVTRKAVKPSEAEISTNPRAHSAKLRVAERTDNP